MTESERDGGRGGGGGEEGGKERERKRDRDRQTNRETETETERPVQHSARGFLYHQVFKAFGQREHDGGSTPTFQDLTIVMAGLIVSADKAQLLLEVAVKVDSHAE